MNLRLVQTACGDAAEADRIARAVVEEGLAACAWVLPAHRSVYRWKGAVCADQEVAVQCKTDETRLDALVARIRALHSYETPVLESWRATLHGADAETWLRESLSEGDAGPR